MTVEGAALKEMVMRYLDDDPDRRPSIQEVSQMIKSVKVHGYGAVVCCIYRPCIILYKAWFYNIIYTLHMCDRSALTFESNG